MNIIGFKWPCGLLQRFGTRASSHRCIRLLPCALQVSEAAVFAGDPAKETQETLFQCARRQLLIIHSQFWHLRDTRSVWSILLARALTTTPYGPPRAVCALCCCIWLISSLSLVLICVVYLWGDVLFHWTFDSGWADHGIAHVVLWRVFA